MQLPSTVEQLLASCDVIEKTIVSPPWDFMWNSITEEGREKQMFSQAFVVDDDAVLPTPIYDSDSLYIAEAAVKVSFTPNFIQQHSNRQRFRWFWVHRMIHTISKWELLCFNELEKSLFPQPPLIYSIEGYCPN